MVNSAEWNEIWAKRILESVRDLKYGTVQIVIHDGKIVQIDRTERRRFESGPVISEPQNKRVNTES